MVVSSDSPERHRTRVYVMGGIDEDHNVLDSTRVDMMDRDDEDPNVLDSTRVDVMDGYDI